MNFKERKAEIISIILLAIACYFPIFLHLQNFPIRKWDEAHIVMSAYEMFQTKHWIVVHFNGVPDMWCTKPPLMLWFQSLFIYFFGLNELAVRLPAVIAAFLTCAAVFIFCFKYLKKIQLGIISVLVLITSVGYIKEHVARTGDPDSLMILLVTVYLMCFFIYIEAEEKNRSRYLLYFFIAMTLTVLSKGVQGLLFLPALLVYTIIRRKFLSVLKDKNFYKGTILFIVFGIGYYFLRELFNPGFLKAVWENELGGRMTKAIEGHEGPFSYYWDLMLNEDFSYWYMLVPCGMLVGFSSASSAIRNTAIYFSLSLLSYFLIVSGAQTKLSWYEGPMFPILAIIVGLFLTWIYDVIRTQEQFKVGLRTSMAVAFIPMFLFFINPYIKTVSGLANFKEYDWGREWYEIPYFLKDEMHNNKNVDGAKIIFTDWYYHIVFYQKMLEERGQHIHLAQLNELKSGDLVIAENETLFSSIESKFNVQILAVKGTVKMFRLISIKENIIDEN